MEKPVATALLDKSNRADKNKKPPDHQTTRKFILLNHVTRDKAFHSCQFLREIVDAEYPPIEKLNGISPKVACINNHLLSFVCKVPL